MCQTRRTSGISLSLSVVLNVLGGLSKDHLALGVLNVVGRLVPTRNLNTSKHVIRDMTGSILREGALAV